VIYVLQRGSGWKQIYSGNTCTLLERTTAIPADSVPRSAGKQ